MKGILYCGFVLNRMMIVASGILTAALSIVCSILTAVLKTSPELASVSNMVVIFAQMLVIIVCFEWVDRQFERDIKSRFTDMTLAAGVSKGAYVFAKYVEILIFSAMGFLMSLVINAAVFLTEKAVGLDFAFWSAGFIKISMVFALLAMLIDFAAYPLIIKLRSAEKAGLTVGLILGFGIISPLMLFFNWYTANVGELNLLGLLAEFSEEWYFFPAVIGAAAALSALFGVITLKRIKRGDVC